MTSKRPREMFVLRHVAERLSRGVVLKRRLPRTFGRRQLYVSPDAALRYWKLGSTVFDAALLRFAEEFVRRGDIVFDIGANVGVFSYAASQRAGSTGRVVAAEPDEWLASILRRSLQLSTPDEAPVAIVNVAGSSSSGFASFSIAARGRASNFLSMVEPGSQAGGVREERVVATTTIGALADHFGSPSVIKIDVEGAEPFVLRGAISVLARDRPIIMCEVYKHNADEIATLLHSHDYVLFEAVAVGPLPRIAEPAFNTIACPRERLASFPSLAA